MKIKAVADLVGISVRTLHYYDEINLLKPSLKTDSGYRVYSDKDIDTLQQIIFFKSMGMPLDQIKSIIKDPNFNPIDALLMHQKGIIKKRDQLDLMLQTVENTIDYLKGEKHMANEDKFKGFDFSHNPYEEEAVERWGQEKVDESKAKLNKLSKYEQEAFAKEFDEVYRHLASIRHQDPISKEAQAGIKRWYLLLNKMGNFPPEAFKAIGQMYVDDKRFMKNIDKYGEGLTVFMRDAMAYFADHQ